MRRLGTPKPGVGWSKACEDMRRNSVALSYTAVNVELRVCVGTSLRLVRPSLPPTPQGVKGQLRRVDDRNTVRDGTAPGGRRHHMLQRAAPLGYSARRAGSLQVDGGAGAFELRLGLVGLLPGDLLEHGLRRGVDQVLGLLEAEAGEGADLLDDLDLLVAGALQHDVELGLLLGRLGRGPVPGHGRPGGHGHGGGGGHVEGLLELLHELRQLQEGHLLEGVQEVVGGQLRHGGSPYSSDPSAAAGASFDSVAGASPSAFWSRRAAVMVATWRSGAASRFTVCWAEAWSSPARRASRTSRDSRVASRRTSSAARTLPSITPPLTIRAGWVRANSARSLAACTGSPWTKATAVGPCSRPTRSS